MSDDKANDVTDPVREHLDKAENWLVLAEGNRGELINLHERVSTYGEEADAQRWYFRDMMASAASLAELHRAMAQALYDMTPQRIEVNAPDWAGDVAANGRLLFGGTELEDTERAVREKMQADAEEFQAQTLRPGADPEPVAEGELWTTGDGWFYYAVDTIPPMLPGMVEKPRWLLARHYAQVLRWSSEQSVKPMAYTWTEVGESLTDGDVCGTLRRPTAEERKAFYGPEPDPQPAIEETHERTTTIPPAPVAWFPENDVTMKAWLRGLDPAQLNRLVAAAKNERTERLYAE